MPRAGFERKSLGDVTLKLSLFSLFRHLGQPTIGGMPKLSAKFRRTRRNIAQEIEFLTLESLRLDVTLKHHELRRREEIRATNDTILNREGIRGYIV